MMKLLTLALLIGAAAASCPNDCSGNGECNIYSACECYRNWVGADCSERTCMYGVAFVDTPQGDLNSDSFVSTELFRTRASNDKDWEIYPYYAGWGSVNYRWAGMDAAGGIAGSANYATGVTVEGDSGGEAHFYKECSAKGDCDRASGLCTCFPGYEGQGCRRVACPNQCSGHGECRTIEDQKFMGPHTSPRSVATFDYAAWDAEVSQQCQCEKGWFGLDCSQRECPKGDDPVTKYQGFTRIKFMDTTGSTGHDLGQALYDSTTTTAAANRDAWGFTPKIISHNVGSSLATSSKLLYSQWYVKATETADPNVVAGDGAMTGTPSDEWVGENRGVVYQSGMQAAHVDYVLTGSKSGARGVQRRFPVGDPAANPVKAPGCCYWDASATPPATDCGQCDFFSYYLSDVTGEFQLGDQIQITFEKANDEPAGTAVGNQAGNALRIGNYIESIDTYYNKKLVQREEEQVLKITFVSAFAGPKRFQGYFALTFTDDFGDEYTTEAIQVRAAGAATCVAGTTGFGQTTAVRQCSEAHETLQGDFVLHGSANAGSASADYIVASGSVSDDDLAGGRAVAKQIAAALEALPGRPTGDVQVDYAYHKTASSKARHFVVRFMDQTGDVPELKVSYAFTDNGKIHTNQGCGAVGEIQNIIITDQGDGDATHGYDACGTSNSFALNFFNADKCQRAPIATATCGGVNSKQIIAINILDRGMGCTHALSFDFNNAGTPDNKIAGGGVADNGNAAAKALVVMNRPTETSAFLTCVSGGVGESATGKIGGDTVKMEVMQTAFVTGAAALTCADDQCQSVWNRSGSKDTLGRRGTTENVECSNRGACDYSSGQCQCYVGFSSADCSVQNALAGN